MRADEFRAALDALGLKQSGERGADAFLGVGEATIRRWARGDTRGAAGGIPDAVAMLLAIMLKRKIKPGAARVILDNAEWPESREGATS